MILIRDNREQCGYDFSRFDVEVRSATLNCGDYSLPGMEEGGPASMSIERKSLEDLISCLMGSNRDRFERELQRAAGYDQFCVVVEASLDDVRNGRYRSQMKPHAALQSILTFQLRYRTPFIWAGSRAGGEYVVYSLLEKYAAELEKRCEQMKAGQAQSAPRQKATA